MFLRFKYFQKIVTTLPFTGALALLFCVPLACSDDLLQSSEIEEGDGDDGPFTDGRDGSDAEVSEAGEDSGGFSGIPEGGDGGGQGNGQVEAGTLTAGSWDDNLNLDVYQDYLDGMDTQTNNLPNIDPTPQSIPAGDGDMLDVVFVIDTTGSMTDEMSYLLTELDWIAAAIEDETGISDVNFGLSVYRDEGDDYVAQAYDFTGDVDVFRTTLADQEADGGGDYPEAMERGLQEGLNLQWRAAAHKVLFLLADAPPHAENNDALMTEVSNAAAAEVVVFPVASSGVDDVTEYLMRAMAQQTGGRYLFLTDDSGVGGSHAEPTIPCYHVTALNQLMVDMVQGVVSGAYTAPEQDTVVRTSGEVQGNQCLQEGEVIAELY